MNKITPPHSSSSIIRELAPYMSLGTQLTFTVLLFAALGWFIDERNASSPLWIGILSGLGGTIGLANLIRSLVRLSKTTMEPRVQQSAPSTKSHEEN